jgi:UDP-glucose 4-epimerase
MTKILVTGSSGMIGTALCEKFLELGIDFIGVDKVKNSWNDKVNQKTFIADLTDESQIKNLNMYLCETEIDMIIHLAANARVFDLIIDTNKAVENVIMTNNTYEIARKNNVNKLIVASSREVYGEDLQSMNKKIEESANHLKCSNQYAASKIFLESLAIASKHIFGIDTIIARFSNVYGRYDISDRFIPKMIQKMLKNEPVDIYGGDEKMMDFTYLDDTIHGVLLLIEKYDIMKMTNINNGVYNISSGVSSKLYEVALEIWYELQSISKINKAPNRQGEPLFYVADISKIKSYEYLPLINIHEGIKKSINYYKKIYAQQ